MPAGRPSEYSEELIPRIKELAEAGATDSELADYIGVSVNTLYRWKHEHREFRYVLKSAKDEADERVERSLYQKALAGDTTASIFWLKNRRSKEWKDQRQLTGLDDGPIEFVVKSILEDK